MRRGSTGHGRAYRGAVPQRAVPVPNPARYRQVRMRLTRHISGGEDPRIAGLAVLVYDDSV
jgi:hypothetical protein